MPSAASDTRPRPDDAPADVLARIREQTRELHRSLERRAPLLDPELTLPAYLGWLVLMRDFHARIEQALQAAGFESATGWSHRSRVALAAQDLAVLSLQPEIVSHAEGCFEGLEFPSSVAGLAGALYVVEGSALGGQVILKLLGRRLGLSAQRGASFFAPHGEDPGPHWAACIELLHELARDDALADSIVAGAEQTFQALDTAAGRWQAGGVRLTDAATIRPTADS